GGASWRSQVLNLPGSLYLFDPSVAADNRGNFYVAFGNNVNASPIYSLLEVLKSTDGGKTFSSPVNAGIIVDKPWITADPDSGILYAIAETVSNGGFGVSFMKSVDGGATFSTHTLIGTNKQGGITDALVVGPNGELYLTWLTSICGDP